MTLRRSLLFLCGSGILPATGTAQNGPVGLRPAALEVTGSLGYPTHKSDLADHNDTGLEYRYGIGVSGGDAHQVGAEVRGASLTTAFARADRSVTLSHRDFVFLYRFWYVHIGGSVGTGAFVASEGALTAPVDATYNAAGAVFGFDAPLSGGSRLRCEGAFAKPFAAREAQNQSIVAGPRIEGECAAAMPLIRRRFDVEFGLRFFQFALEGPGASGVERVTAPFAGLRLSLLSGH